MGRRSLNRLLAIDGVLSSVPQPAGDQISSERAFTSVPARHAARADVLRIDEPAQLHPYLSSDQSPAALLGVEWFPSASVYRPETFCFVRSVRDVPVALIDGNTGKVSLACRDYSQVRC